MVIKLHQHQQYHYILYHLILNLHVCIRIDNCGWLIHYLTGDHGDDVHSCQETYILKGVPKNGSQDDFGTKVINRKYDETTSYVNVIFQNNDITFII